MYQKFGSQEGDIKFREVDPGVSGWDAALEETEIVLMECLMETLVSS